MSASIVVALLGLGVGFVVGATPPPVRYLVGAVAVLTVAGWALVIVGGDTNVPNSLTWSAFTPFVVAFLLGVGFGSWRRLRRRASA
jgi:uncharacterized membrane protein